MIGRTVYDIALFASLFIAPFWCTLLIAALGIFIFPRYVEAIALFVIVDLIFHAPTSTMRATNSAIMVPLSLYAFLAVLLRTWIGMYLRNRSV